MRKPKVRTRGKGPMTVNSRIKGTKRTGHMGGFRRKPGRARSM
jgi:hypothetical protein